MRDPSRLDRAGCLSAPANPGYWIGSSIGLDGYTGAGANLVLQAGIGQDVYYQSGSLHRDIYPWYEWYPDDIVKIAGVPASPGDFVVVIISAAIPPGQGSANATIYFANTPNGASMSVPVSAPRGVQLVGNSAEWIVEPPLPIPGWLHAARLRRSLLCRL